MTARRIAIVPHTHWDREWYKSYQDFRLNLVDMLDTLLPLLESDDSYPYFMLDGQMAVVDDYLEVRPQAEQRIRDLAAAGRISMGPWYILMDEFLSSGETIIRNLQMGIVRGAAFGGAMEVGYLPDMFGHIAQMPQILRAGRVRPRRRVARRALGRHEECVRLGGARRVRRTGRVPARGVRQRRRAARAMPRPSSGAPKTSSKRSSSS
jgi:alpha-mannosidase